MEGWECFTRTGHFTGHKWLDGALDHMDKALDAFDRSDDAGSGLIQRKTPPQAGISGKPAIQADPLAAGLQCERCVVGVWNVIASGLRFATQISKNFPMSVTRRKHMHLFSLSKILHKLQRDR